MILNFLVSDDQTWPYICWGFFVSIILTMVFIVCYATTKWGYCWHKNQIITSWFLPSPTLRFARAVQSLLCAWNANFNSAQCSTTVLDRFPDSRKADWGHGIKNSLAPSPWDKRQDLSSLSEMDADLIKLQVYCADLKVRSFLHVSVSRIVCSSTLCESATPASPSCVKLLPQYGQILFRLQPWIGL